MKTKLGISVALLAAATYFMGLFSGYVALTILPATYYYVKKTHG